MRLPSSIQILTLSTVILLASPTFAADAGDGGLYAVLGGKTNFDGGLDLSMSPGRHYSYTGTTPDGQSCSLDFDLTSYPDSRFDGHDRWYQFEVGNVSMRIGGQVMSSFDGSEIQQSPLLHQALRLHGLSKGFQTNEVVGANDHTYQFSFMQGLLGNQSAKVVEDIIPLDSYQLYSLAAQDAGGASPRDPKALARLSLEDLKKLQPICESGDWLHCTHWLRGAPPMAAPAGYNAGKAGTYECQALQAAPNPSATTAPSVAVVSAPVLQKKPVVAAVAPNRSPAVVENSAR